MSVFQNQDGWWGEGDDMFFVDGESRPSINGTGLRRLFPGRLGFWRPSFFLIACTAHPVVGEETPPEENRPYIASTWIHQLRLQSRSAPAFEHGHANHRSDNYYSVAYWYQTEPHASFPVLPSVASTDSASTTGRSPVVRQLFIPDRRPLGGPELIV